MSPIKKLSIKRHSRSRGAPVDISLPFPIPPPDIPRSSTHPPTLPFPLPLPILSLTPASPDSSFDLSHSSSLADNRSAILTVEDHDKGSEESCGEAEAYWKWRDEQCFSRRSGDAFSSTLDPEKRWEMLKKESETRTISSSSKWRGCSFGADSRSKLWLLRLAIVLILVATAIGLAVGFSRPNEAATYEAGVLITTLDSSGVEHTISIKTRLSKNPSPTLKASPPSSSGPSKTTSASSGGGGGGGSAKSTASPSATGHANAKKTQGATSAAAAKNGQAAVQSKLMRERERREKRRAVAFGEARHLGRRLAQRMRSERSL